MKKRTDFNFPRIVFPPLNPEIEPIIDRSYKFMERNRKRGNLSVRRGGNRRRCNRCGSYFNIEDTVMIRYYEYSARRYRVCVRCSELFETLPVVYGSSGQGCKKK